MQEKKQEKDPKIKIEDLAQDEKAQQDEAGKVTGGLNFEEVKQSFDPKTIQSGVLKDEEIVGLVNK